MSNLKNKQPTITVGDKSFSSVELALLHFDQRCDQLASDWNKFRRYYNRSSHQIEISLHDAPSDKGLE